MEDTTVDVVMALFWEIWYLLVFSDQKKADSYAWGMMGLTMKLAQSVCGVSHILWDLRRILTAKPLELSLVCVSLFR